MEVFPSFPDIMPSSLRTVTAGAESCAWLAVTTFIVLLTVPSEYKHTNLAALHQPVPYMGSESCATSLPSQQCLHCVAHHSSRIRTCCEPPAQLRAGTWNHAGKSKEFSIARMAGVRVEIFFRALTLLHCVRIYSTSHLLYFGGNERKLILLF